jgi:hypothetical protein
MYCFCSRSGMAETRPFDSSHTREKSRAWYLTSALRNQVSVLSLSSLPPPLLFLDLHFPLYVRFRSPFTKSSSLCPLRSHVAAKKRSIDSPVSAVTEDRDDSMARTFSPRQFRCGPHIQGRRGADVDPFFVEQSVDHFDRFGIGNVKCAGEEGEIGSEVGGDSALSDT